MNRRRSSKWVATIAPLLVWVIISAPIAGQAQTRPAPAGAAPAASNKSAILPAAVQKVACKGRQCVLVRKHWNFIQKRINKLLKKMGELQGKIRTLEARPATTDPAVKKQLEAERGRMGVLQAQLDNLHAELKKAKKTPAPVRIVADPLPPWAEWHWGILLSVGAPAFTGAAKSHVPTWLKVTLFGRWVSPSHLGLEAGVSPGLWFTEDTVPFTLSGHLFGVASWKNWGLFLGPEASYLQSPITGAAGYTLATVQGGAELKLSNFMLRLALGGSLYSPLKRLSGLWGQLSVGADF